MPLTRGRHEEHDEPEHWLPIPGYEGMYDVSDLGCVRSVPRIDPLGRPLPGGFLKPRIRGRYNTVSLMRGGKPKYIEIHRLVLLAFVGPLPPGMETRHGPSGGFDNRLSNLSYGTPSENRHDMIRDGSIRRNGQLAVKLTPSIVAECRRRYAAGETRNALAAEFGVSGAAMTAAIRGTSWRSVPNPHTAPPAGRAPNGQFLPGQRYDPTLRNGALQDMAIEDATERVAELVRELAYATGEK